MLSNISALMEIFKICFGQESVFKKNEIFTAHSKIKLEDKHFWELMRLFKNSLQKYNIPDEIIKDHMSKNILPLKPYIVQNSIYKLSFFDVLGKN